MSFYFTKYGFKWNILLEKNLKMFLLGAVFCQTIFDVLRLEQSFNKIALKILLKNERLERRLSAFPRVFERFLSDLVANTAQNRSF